MASESETLKQNMEEAGKLSDKVPYKQETELVQTNTTAAADDNNDNDGRPSLAYHSYGAKTVLADDALFHLIISIRQADVVAWCTDRKNENWWHKMDLYVEVAFDNNAKIETTRKIYRSNGCAQFNYVKRCTFTNCEEMPKTLTFTVKKYRENGEDVFVGQKVYDVSDSMQYSNNDKEEGSYVCREPLKDKDGNIMPKNTLWIGVYFKHCSLMSLKEKMISEMKLCGKDKMNPQIIKWVEDNKKLLKKLKANEALGVQISDQDFSDLNYPSFEMMDDGFKGFLRSFHTITHVYGLTAMNYKKYYSKWSKHKYKKHKYQMQMNKSHSDDEEDNKEDDDANYQIYYDPDFDILYFSEVSSFYFGGENITKQVQLLFRYVFLRDILLKGQDNEFNIYRSYYMDPSKEKVAMGLLALMLQIVLTAAISVDVFSEFSIDDILDQDALILVGAVMTFCFLTYTSWNSVNLFRDWYRFLPVGYQVPWTMVLFDYISNVLLEAYVTVISVIFLAQSPDLTELVLNAFALNFIVRIDDVINVFDSDEEVMVMKDLRAFEKANCEAPRVIQFRSLDYLAVFLVPMRIFEVIYRMIEQFGRLLIFGEYSKVCQGIFKWDEDESEEDKKVK